MGKFVIRRTASGFKFDLKASNGEVIATSEVYTSAALCRKGIDSVCKCAVTASVAELADQASNPCFRIYTDKAGEFRFRLHARNGKVIAVSEGYASRNACIHGIESVRRQSNEGAVTEKD